MWALRDYGFQVVLSPKFADIFRGNSGKQGLVTGVITEDDVERIWAAVEAHPGASRSTVISTPGCASTWSASGRRSRRTRASR